MRQFTAREARLRNVLVSSDDVWSEVHRIGAHPRSFVTGRSINPHLEPGSLGVRCRQWMWWVVETCGGRGLARFLGHSTVALAQESVRAANDLQIVPCVHARSHSGVGFDLVTSRHVRAGAFLTFYGGVLALNTVQDSVPQTSLARVRAAACHRSLPMTYEDPNDHPYDLMLHRRRWGGADIVIRAPPLAIEMLCSVTEIE